MDPQVCGQLTFDKVGKNIHWTKDGLFNKWCWENVRQESIKILEENTGNTLFKLSHSNFLQDKSTKAKETKAKMNYCDYIKIRSFFTAKDTVNKTKRQPKEWRRYLQMTYQIKG